MKDTKELARRLLAHFTFEPGGIPPTFSEFRQQAGLSYSEFSALCEDEDFAEAMRDARARYLDTLTVGALLKKYDASFVKYLLDAAVDGESKEGKAPENVTVEVRVVE